MGSDRVITDDERELRREAHELGMAVVRKMHAFVAAGGDAMTQEELGRRVSFALLDVLKGAAVTVHASGMPKMYFREAAALAWNAAEDQVEIPTGDPVAAAKEDPESIKH